MKIMFAINTYNRKEVLKKMINSLSKLEKISYIDIHIFDDKSSEYKLEDLKKMIPFAKNITVRKENLRADRNMYQMYIDFLNTDYDYLFQIDSDMIFNENIINFLLNLIKEEKDAVYSFYNSNYHKEINEGKKVIIQGLEFIQKEDIGGACVFFPRKVLKKIVENILIENDDFTSYDFRWSEYLIKEEIPIYVTEKSFVQHIGLEGQNQKGGEIFDIGKNFIPSNFEDIQLLCNLYEKIMFDYEKIILKNKENFENYEKALANYKKICENYEDKMKKHKIIFGFYTLLRKIINILNNYKGKKSNQEVIKNKIKISIIIPIYNLEKYIERCVESLINLKIENEIILIDDGSKDNSLLIAEKLKRKYKDKNIKVIAQENKGLPETRNTGLREAIGEYISFIDCDDFVDLDLFEEMINRTIFERLDIGIGNLKYYYSEKDPRNKKRYRNPEIYNNGVNTGKKYFEYLIKLDEYRPEVYDDIYRREFLIENNIYFNPVKMHEDELFSVEVMLPAKRVNLFDITFYNYQLEREGSIMNQKTMKNYIDVLETVKDIMKLCENYKKGSGIRQALIGRAFNLYKFVIESTRDNYFEEHLDIRKENKKILLQLSEEAVREQDKVESAYYLSDGDLIEKYERENKKD